MITRFAPSPTGPLHLGHAYSACIVWDMAARAQGTALLRIEDTDSTRARPEWELSIYEDLAWLGLAWPRPVRRQSDHLPAYRRILDQLAARELLYPCSCSRRQIVEAGAVPGVDGPVYPGTCRNRSMDTARPTDALRLDLRKALAGLKLPDIVETGPLHTGCHALDPAELVATRGDPVLRRSENEDIAYLLACTHDDALQEITHVIRGADNWANTGLQIVLQAIMGWPTPVYHHHDLIRDADGKRLAKIDKSKALALMRAEGATPGEIRRLLGLVP